MKKRLLPDLASFSRSKPTVAGGVDFIYALGTDEGLVKIGMTNNWWGRINKLRGMSPKRLQPLMFWACRSGRKVEAALHVLFRDYRCHGEWFDFRSHHGGFETWKCRHLALSALLTCLRPPVPIACDIYNLMQREHIQEDDPCWNFSSLEELDRNLIGRDCYPTELFAPFTYNYNEDSFATAAWSAEMCRLYRVAFKPIAT